MVCFLDQFLILGCILFLVNMTKAIFCWCIWIDFQAMIQFDLYSKSNLIRVVRLW